METLKEKVKVRAQIASEVSAKKVDKTKPTLLLYKNGFRTDCLMTCDRYEFVESK